jgi:hypothetical protein
LLCRSRTCGVGVSVKCGSVPTNSGSFKKTMKDDLDRRPAPPPPAQLFFFPLHAREAARAKDGGIKTARRRGFRTPSTGQN